MKRQAHNSIELSKRHLWNNDSEIARLFEVRSEAIAVAQNERLADTLK